MKTISNLAVVGMILLAGCNKSGVGPATPNSKANMSVHSTNSLASNPNGVGGVENIYYDGQLFMMNLKPFTDQPASSLLANNKSINILYQADGFITVTDAIQTDGYNPVWQEVDIVFNNGVTPHQFLSDTDVLAAASGPNATITLVPTHEIYRCDIIQHTKAQ